MGVRQSLNKRGPGRGLARKMGRHCSSPALGPIRPPSSPPLCGNKAPLDDLLAWTRHAQPTAAHSNPPGHDRDRELLKRELPTQLAHSIPPLTHGPIGHHHHHACGARLVIRLPRPVKDSPAAMPSHTVSTFRIAKPISHPAPLSLSILDIA